MSIVVAVGNKNKIILASDGRRTDKLTDGTVKILQEDYCKFTQIHNQLYIGYTGNVSLCEQAIDVFIKYYSKNFSYQANIENSTDFLISIIKNIIGNNKCGAQFMICGITPQNELGITYFNNLNNIYYIKLKDEIFKTIIFQILQQLII